MATGIKANNTKEQSILLSQVLKYQRSKLEKLGKIHSSAKQKKAKDAKTVVGRVAKVLCLNLLHAFLPLQWLLVCKVKPVAQHFIMEGA